MASPRYKVGEIIPDHDKPSMSTSKREALVRPGGEFGGSGFEHRVGGLKREVEEKVPTIGETDFTSELHGNWRRRMGGENEVGLGVDISADFVGGWRRRIMESLEAGDVEGMKQEAALMAQLRTIEIGMESVDDRVALDANKFLLSQAGHGPINKVEHSMRYEGLPEDQLAAMVMSKLKRLGEHKPALLEAAKVALGGVVEAEYEEVNGGAEGIPPEAEGGGEG